MNQSTNSAPHPKSPIEVVKDAFKELAETFSAFVKSPRALWGINLPYVLEGLVYFGILTILGKFASENVQLSDVHASWVYSWVTGGITLAMVILGGFSDKLGVRRSLLLAFTLMLVGRILVAYSGTIELGKGLFSPMFNLMFSGLTIMVIGYGLYQPAAYAGVKRFTTPKTASMGYAVIYGLMNLGAFFSGFISPMVRHNFETTFPPNGLTAVFWVYVIITGLALIFTAILLTKKADREAVARVERETKELESEQETGKTEATSDQGTTKEKVDNRLLFSLIGMALITNIIFILFYKNSDTIAPMTKYAWIGIDSLLVLAMGYEYLRHRPDHPFRDVRFLFFIFILIPVQTLFAHNWLTIPYYLDRAFRGSMVSNYFELFSNINPILIFVLTPIVAGLTARANVYKMMIYGTIVMAAPTFLLALGPRVELFLLYILLMSIGEAMWQPRFLQWIAEIAPEGKTGAYMGIGQLPWFLTKVITGMYSGYFVAKYCPIPGPGVVQNTEFMWFFHGMVAIISPIALILAKNWMMKGMKTKHSS